MEYRLLGDTGLLVSALSFGAVTFGGKGAWYELTGATQVSEARELVSIALDSGINMFDTADGYSGGLSEEILGQALGSRRDGVLLSTKVHARIGPDVNDVGSSRHHILRACEASLKRLGTDHVDLYQVHGFDGLTDVAETLCALDDLVRQGKVRYTGCSNFSGWQLMKSLAVADNRQLGRYKVLQAYYSLLCRDAEHELIPLCLDQGVGLTVWSPLAGGFLSGKFRRDEEWPADTRVGTAGFPELDVEHGYRVLDVVEEIARERGVTAAEISLNWLLRKQGITSVITGARTRGQLEINLRAATWQLTGEQLDRLDQVSSRPLPYPYWHQFHYNAERQPRLPGVQPNTT
jgi:aryl-alcohol dehydrogenase-like predicted oxidoreductase